VQGAAFQALRDLAPGDTVVLLLACDPALLMRSLDLQLRHKLAWTVARSDQRWRVEVSHRADRAPRDVLDLLERDHQRLDGLLVSALRSLNRGLAQEAVPLLGEFARAMRGHMAVEDEIVVAALGIRKGGAANVPLQIMLRDHAEIGQQLALIEEALAEPDEAQLNIYCAILSGTLAKHEHREESDLFSRWRVQLAALPRSFGEELLARTRAALAP
jgi:hypothetical protein